MDDGEDEVNPTAKAQELLALYEQGILVHKDEWAGLVKSFLAFRKMTPECAREIYFAALTESYYRFQAEYKKPRVQHQCEMEAWQAVLLALNPNNVEAK